MGGISSHNICRFATIIQFEAGDLPSGAFDVLDQQIETIKQPIDAESHDVMDDLFANVPAVSNVRFRLETQLVDVSIVVGHEQRTLNGRERPNLLTTGQLI
jgi:hypothetical protein